MNASKNNSLFKQLQEISQEPRSLRSTVAKEILNYDLENIKGFFEDLSEVSPICNIIGKYNYYQHTHKFYDEHYDEIEFFRKENPNYFSEAVKSDYDLKTLFCWFTFEDTANELANELGLEI